MTEYGPDIYTEPEADPDTLANLGPLRPMAGIWEGTKGSDEHPAVEGTENNAFVEHYELHPIDRQTNGPQLSPRRRGQPTPDGSPVSSCCSTTGPGSRPGWITTPAPPRHRRP